MFRTEVEEWLSQIGLDELYNYFVQDGFTTLDSVRRMRQSDIDAIVDRRGYMIILNEEIDRLNYGDANANSYNPAPLDRSSRAASYVDYEPERENREALMSRYESGGLPSVGFASRHLARRAKSTTRKNRGASVAFGTRSSVERYVPNSASDAYESLIASKRAASVAVTNAREVEQSSISAAIEARQKKRDEERQSRAKTGKFKELLIKTLSLRLNELYEEI